MSAARDRILLVDDEPILRFGIRDYLESKGFQVEEAATLAAARMCFQRERPDAMVLDYALPDGNALELVEELRAMDSQVPVILLTGHGSIDLAVRAIKEGAEQLPHQAGRAAGAASGRGARPRAPAGSAAARGEAQPASRGTRSIAFLGSSEPSHAGAGGRPGAALRGPGPHSRARPAAGKGDPGALAAPATAARRRARRSST